MPVFVLLVRGLAQLQSICVYKGHLGVCNLIESPCQAMFLVSIDQKINLTQEECCQPCRPLAGAGDHIQPANIRPHSLCREAGGTSPHVLHHALEPNQGDSSL